MITKIGHYDQEENQVNKNNWKVTDDVTIVRSRGFVNSFSRRTNFTKFWQQDR